MTLEQYIHSINLRYKLGNATEHTFRGDLQLLIESLVPGIRATNEPKRQSCGAPDYILTKKDIPVGFIEAKDLGDKDLEGAKKTGNKEQFDRYKSSLNNLIFTDYLDFYLYRDGEFVSKISIGEITPKGIKPLTENFSGFENFIKDFCMHIGQTIKSSKKLAEMMAGKARLLSEVIEKALNSDENKQEDSTLKDQMTAFRQILIHDITAKGFADVYAQTITYGMFAARYHDPTLPTFSRQEAYELIPKTNPFLKKLFGYIAGLEVDDRIKWIVDDLVNIFLACNVEEMLKNYGRATKMEDPIIHFYEDFLSEYDPKLRKARGVWYTPQPVVNFIVRAVDDILKTEFDLPQGLADTSKSKINVNVQGKQVEQEIHKVQILDPATGTGTFLAEAIKHIHKKFEGQQGIWSNYVENHLLPRLNGFELLMASYAMAHLKLDLLLTETGYKPTTNQRLRVYLTNSLEEHHEDTGTLFANWLSAEANEANHIKRDTPVMCVIGNPPYAVSSTNKNEWIDNLIADYKKDLNEKSYNSLSDDYVKFIRYGQHFIEKNGSGVLAYISNNSFIDGIVFRQMRKHLLECFDKIYILDLHGNARKKEVCLDGSADQNVFDIMQGVSVNIFVKTNKKKKTELGEVYHYDLQGKRNHKYQTLNNSNISEIKWSKLAFKKPYYFFVPKDFESEEKYKKGFKVDELFRENSSGIKSHRDYFVYDVSKDNLLDKVKIFIDEKNSDEYITSVLGVKSNRDWDLKTKRARIVKEKNHESYVIKVEYKPFNKYYCYYNLDAHDYHRYELLRNMFNDNLLLMSSRKDEGSIFKNIFITKNLGDIHSVSDQTYCFPLYLYPETTGQQTLDQSTARRPNLNAEIVEEIAKRLGMKFVTEKDGPPTPTPQPPEGETFPHPTNNGKNEGESLRIPTNNGKNDGESLHHPTFDEMTGLLEEQMPGYITANPNTYKWIKEFRKTLKDHPTEAEKVMWEYLRNKQLGHKIRRQHIIGDFITDFVCLRKKLVIEIDGKIHEKQKEYDELRTACLNDWGYTVIRFTNEAVFANPESVAASIKLALDTKDDLQTDPEENILREDEEAYSSNSTGAGNSPSGGQGVGGGGDNAQTFSPIDLLDYIYAVLHSPTYREKYKEFLKIDFPRVPYPKDAATFWKLVELGGQIRQIHLLESPVVTQYITQYPVDGDNKVSKLKYQDGRVYINENQYFDKVPQVAWEFYIGGYQPAQKWLKDRKDRKLEFDDVLHYQKIIVALTETDRLMKAVDEIEIA